MFRESIVEKAKQAISDNVFPGGVVGVVRKSGDREVIPFGNYTYDQNSHLVKENSIYDTASLTKSIPTGSLAMQLIDEGKLKLEDKLIDYIPEFNNSDRESITVRHLLTYTLDGYGLASAVDGTDGKSLGDRGVSDLLKTLLNHNFEQRPGTIFKYSNIPAALLGLVVERITGHTLGDLATERFFRPLGMNRSTFNPSDFPLEDIVPTEITDWRGLVHGEVHDESAYIAKRDGKVMGHAGLFSTAPDILNFLEMLLQGGTMSGEQYFSKWSINQMMTNQIAELNDYTGLGWELNQPRYMGDFCSPNTFGKTGFTGTLAICDIEKEVAYVILTNRIYPKRPADSTAINVFRKAVGEIVLKSLA